MSNRQQIFLISGIIILAIIALVEGIFLLRQSGLAGNLTSAFDRALAPLLGSRNDSSQAKNQLKAQEDLILQETAEDLERMQNQINRLFCEMTRDTAFPRRNIRTMDSAYDGHAPFENIKRLQSEIGRIFQMAHDSRHNGALNLIEQDWRDVGPTSSVNIEGNNTNYVVTVSMPGFERTNIDINISGRILAIEADVEKQAFANGARSDSANRFKTQIMLPSDISGESAQAFYENSVLKITIPKKPAGNSLAHKVTIM